MLAGMRVLRITNLPPCGGDITTVTEGVCTLRELYRLIFLSKGNEEFIPLESATILAETETVA